VLDLSCRAGETRVSLTARRIPAAEIFFDIRAVCGYLLRQQWEFMEN